MKHICYICFVLLFALLSTKTYAKNSSLNLHNKTGKSFASSSVNSSDNLIINGSFESPIVENNNWHLFNEIDGWKNVAGPGIEIQRNVAGKALDGEQLLELDSMLIVQ